MSAVLTKKALARIKKVHQLSRKYNGPSQGQHLAKLLLLMRKHAQEITLLHRKKDLHYLIEVGDLLILCFEILLENRRSIDATARLCFTRYEKKLTQLLARSA